MWRNRCFTTTHTRTNKLIALEDVLKEGLLTHRHFLKAVVSTVKALKELHDKDIVQEKFQIKDIQITFKSVSISSEYIMSVRVG